MCFLFVVVAILPRVLLCCAANYIEVTTMCNNYLTKISKKSGYLNQKGYKSEKKKNNFITLCG
jgi:hypothetical protein